MSKKLVSGSLLLIKLPDNFGFAFGLYVDISESIDRYFDSNLLLVFNKISNEPNVDLDVLTTDDLLFGPAILTGRPSTRTWKIIGQKEELLNTWRIPDFKTVRSFPYIVEDESKIGPWSFIRKMGEKEQAPYEKVRHLEQPVLQAEDQIEARIVMEIYRREGKDPKDFMNLKEDYINRVYLRMINVPIYDEIPKEMRGKALI